MMQKIGEKLHLAERNVLATPSLPLNDAPPVSTTPSPDSMLDFLNGPADQQAPSIKLDDDDETCPADATVISHVGPVEGKLLQGSDKRLYVLEVSRLTPLDANFVSKDKGGAGNIDALASVDAETRMTYCLRQELLQEYVNTETMSLRQSELQVLLGKLQEEEKELEKKDKALEDSKKEESTEKTEKSTDSDKEKEKEEDTKSSQEVSTGDDKKKEEGKEEEETDLSAQVPAEELERITKLECSVLFNPNCFLGDVVLCKDNA
mgnify:FL=1